MGQFNSSEWRVAPVFDSLIELDETGQSWLPRLLRLPSREGHERVAISAAALGSLEEAAWRSATGPRKEKPLPAPRALLEWLILNVDPSRTRSLTLSSETERKRHLLGQRNPVTQADAKKLLALGNSGKDWHVLEGSSYPDVYLQTATTIVVIEGKLTEVGPTTKTTWMGERHQMLRHIDAAWDYRDGRSVYGFFVIDDRNALGWKTAATTTVSADALKKSLPHRTSDERAQIAKAFLGITTWTDVCTATEIGCEILKPVPKQSAR